MTKVADDLTSKCYIILWICIGAFIFRNIFAGIMVMNFQNIRADFSKQCIEKEQEIEEETKERLLEFELAAQYTKNSLESSKARSTSLGCGPHASEFKEFTKRLSLILEGRSCAADASGSDKSLGSNNTNDFPIQKDTTIAKESDETFATSPEAEKIASIYEILNEKLSKHGANCDAEYPESANWNSAVRLNLHNFATNLKETLWPRDTLFRYFQLMEALQDNLAERQQLQRIAVLAISNMLDSASKA